MITKTIGNSKFNISATDEQFKCGLPQCVAKSDTKTMSKAQYLETLAAWRKDLHETVKVHTKMKRDGCTKRETRYLGHIHDLLAIRAELKALARAHYETTKPVEEKTEKKEAVQV